MGWKSTETKVQCTDCDWVGKWPDDDEEDDAGIQ